MEKFDSSLNQQFEDLIKEGNTLISIAGTARGGLDGNQIARVTSWISKSGQLIQSLCPKESVYFERFSDVLKQENYFYTIHSEHYHHLGVILGCVQAVYDDLRKGLLVNVRSLLRAEIFSDFLEMSEHLLNEGYKDAAAVLTGAVLEDSLRKLASKYGIPVEKADGSLKTLEPLNQELGKAEAYDKLIQKQITSWGDLRNSATHGNFDKYDDAQVRMILLFVQKFCSDYLR